MQKNTTPKSRLFFEIANRSNINTVDLNIWDKGKVIPIKPKKPVKLSTTSQIVKKNHKDMSISLKWYFNATSLPCRLILFIYIDDFILIIMDLIFLANSGEHFTIKSLIIPRKI